MSVLFQLKVIFILGIIVILSACTEQQEPDPGFIRTSGTQFIDSGGRQMIFNGVNVICKDPRKKYTDQFSPDEFRQLASWGFNVVRLGVIWSGLEPNPGEYNEKYLTQIDQLIEWAVEAGLYVLVDMHQDLFGQKFSDGAPDWATLDQDLPHHTGAIWSDSYLISPAIQAAFDNFWANSQAPDGVGVQDRYIAMWKMLALRYHDNPGIVGYDLMNEPFMGTAANKIMPLMIQAYAHETMDMEKAWQEGTLEQDMMNLASRWADESGRLDILRTLENPELYARVIEPAGPICQSFEEIELKLFYQKLRDTIREVDNNHILFLEHNYFANTGIGSNIKLPLDEDGNPDPLLAYAAHAYDLVTDTKEVGSPANSRVQFIFNRIHETSVKLDIPLFIGEWGAYGGNHPVYRETASYIMRLIEEMKCSHSYWNYSGTNFNVMSYFPVLSRVYPMAVAGDLKSYAYNNEDGGFLIELETDGKEKYVSKIFIPDLSLINIDSLKLNSDTDYEIEPLNNGKGGYLLIMPGKLATKLKIQYY
ncbi:MAG: cellulase family glycosylhydrolase [Bacteroidetes bacterium]|nr:cellulase family glycosylhydrolase [Bacteroidota bacterium]